jgi:hypothetical protein
MAKGASAFVGLHNPIKKRTNPRRIGPLKMLENVLPAAEEHQSKPAQRQQ